MQRLLTEQIPETERTFWAIGIDPENPVTVATAPQIWQTYLEFHRQGNWLQALMHINRLADYDHNQPEVWRVKAKLHGVSGHSVCCILAIETLLQLAPHDLDALRMQALFLFCHDSHADALSICDTVLGNNPSQADFWALKADILNSHGKQDEAAKACNRALQIKPDCVAALRLKDTFRQATR